MKKLSFKIKLVISILAMSIIPLVVNSIYSLKSSRAELKNTAFDKLSSLREARNKSITRYLNTVSSQIVTLAHSKMIVEAAHDFMSDYRKLPAASDDDIAKLRKYYTGDFATEYKSKTESESTLGTNIDLLSPQAKMLQHAFISNNKNPLGSKHLQDETPLLPEYSAHHKVYHPIIREFLDTFQLYDVFIVDIESGNIVYTVFKELDFTTNLYTGPYKDTNLAEVVKQARDLKDKKEFKIVDFKRYGPSYEAPASFIATPIWDGDKKIAVLAFQMPLGTINEIMSERTGLGETGETYLVGADKRLRSDTHNDKDFNIYNSFNKEKLINTENIKLALDGKPNAVEAKNYKDVDVLSSFSKIDYPNLPWVIFAEQSSKESFQNADKVTFNVMLFILISTVLVVLISLYITKGLSDQIEEVVETFSSSAHNVQNSSQKMDLISNKLHKSVQTQISSITQSAAAMDEISAMLKNNVQSSKNAFELSQVSKDSALKGKETVQLMLKEVNEISVSYDQIQESVEQNNADINKIVSVISEIAKKTEVINEIVFQTKLLSFNASVEAARAGEAGKGFAVVAEEIASLAAMSGKASADITQMLSTSQAEVKKIADDTKAHVSKIVLDGRKKVEAGNDVAALCMNQLDNIVKTVNELDNSTHEINSALNEQSAGVEEVNSAMNYLENATNDTTDMSERSRVASEELKSQSHALRNSIQTLRGILGTSGNSTKAKKEIVENDNFETKV